MEPTTTNELYIRPLRAEDASDLFAIRSLDEVHKYIFTGPWKSIDEANQWVQDMQNGMRSLMYTIVLKNQSIGDSVIGIVGVNRWDQIHIMVDPKYSTSAYASEALTAFLPILFLSQPKRLSIGAVVSAEDVCGLEVLKTCGFASDAYKQSVTAPDTVEPLEQEELEALKGIGYKPDEGENMLFFRYLKPANN